VNFYDDKCQECGRACECLYVSVREEREEMRERKREREGERERERGIEREQETRIEDAARKITLFK